MSGHVAQGFLRNTEEAERRVARDFRWNVARFYIHSKRLSPRNTITLSAERFQQSEFFNSRGMQAIGQCVDIFAQAHQFLTYRTARAVGQAAFGLSGVDGQTREPLGHVIVQLSGHTAALELMGGEEPLSERA